jgi:thiol-disulfide isomerase/thioredoxin
MPDSEVVIPDSGTVIPDLGTVIPDLIRDPVSRQPWIADVETPDLIRGRNDKTGTRKDHAAWYVPLAIACALTLQACSKAPEVPAAAAPHAAASSVAWVKPDGANVDAIFAQAKAANKPVFLYWGAVWCPPCNQIKATVFNRQDFIERSKSFVPVYLDGDTAGAQKLGARFKVRGYPTMILLRPDGSELTRLPGEVQASQYMEVLNLGLASGSSVKEALAAVQSGSQANLTPEAWRQLAYYSWEQDEAQLVAQKERAQTLDKLARACPPAQAEAASRLALKAMVAAGQDKLALSDKAAALTRVQQILADATLRRSNFDQLVNYAPDLLELLSAAGSSERASLLASWNLALDQFAADTGLSNADRLSAIAAKVALAKVGRAKDDKTALDAALLTQVRAAVLAADKAAGSTYERQAVIPNAADVLSEAGLLAESDAMLKAELPKALSPYYHMLGLAANARHRGDKVAALDWAEQAWNAAKGPATRLQWGIGYVNRLIELAPQDAARIEKAVTGVLAELEAVPETFYERNRRGLEKMGQRLQAWNKGGGHSAVLNKFKLQMDAVCAKLPEQDETRAACASVFKASAGQAKS